MHPHYTELPNWKNVNSLVPIFYFQTSKKDQKYMVLYGKSTIKNNFPKVRAILYDSFIKIFH